MPSREMSWDLTPEEIEEKQMDRSKKPADKIKESIQSFCAGIDWDYFFTGTFGGNITPRGALEATKKYFENYQDHIKRSGNPINYIWFLEGATSKERADYVVREIEGNQGKGFRPIRPHVHALIKDNGRPIQSELWMWWFKKYGRVEVERIDSQKSAIKYVTKYCTKTVCEDDRWNLDLASSKK